MQKYKYLEDLGISRGDCYQNWKEDTKHDRRRSEWKKQRKIYGIDERDTWNWGVEFFDYCYIHLKMFNEVSLVDLDQHIIECGDESITVQDAIDVILEWFETVYYPSNREDTNGYEEVFYLLVDIMPLLWW